MIGMTNDDVDDDHNSSNNNIGGFFNLSCQCLL